MQLQKASMSPQQAPYPLVKMAPS